ncbi:MULTISPECIES: glycosyltransferase family 4 protein [Bacteroides]|jgi:glycosyltransferase involved in cell wall biosynthesis|uniref:Glycosyltransferase WbuB n=1 Tax=Bacteroides intestinalis TaxID=329854 RepID=A0AAQ0LQW1_9BACE|nr:MULTISPECIES: glycosyltransferase family 4 protein [Bacteroides]RGT58254.1 glycosyltransferase WbuB [Bacteroides intestinalis]
MNILFLTLHPISDISERGIYTDLTREFIRHGHQIYIVVPAERRFHLPTGIKESDGAKILSVKTLNIQKTNLIEKGLGTLLLEYQYQRAIRKYWKNIKFDLILYSTPPITFNRVISSVKRRCEAKTYLLLKDIFPQNAVDLGMFSKGSFIYKLFRKKEERLYQLSDYIGCMSPANVEYVLRHNPSITAERVEVCPNSIELYGKESEYNNGGLLQKLNIPTDKLLLIYGGNLGRPQGIDFLMDVLAANEKRTDTYFVVVGNGTEYGKISQWFRNNTPHNSCLIPSLPKQEYDDLVSACDVGLIFLDNRFTIPNYPSRLLSYLENRMSVLMATDMNTDIGPIAEKNGYGLWTESGNLETFMEMVEFVAEDRERLKLMGEKGYDYLKDNYTVERTYRIIMKHFQ